MPALQREIVDERRSRFDIAPFYTGVGSLGVFGFRSGLTGSETVRGVGELIMHPELPGHKHIYGSISDTPQLVNMGTVRTEIRSHTSSLREREREWRRTHAGMLKQYENEWIVLEGETIVAHGCDPLQVIQEARRNNIENPYIFFVEQDDENVIKIGL